MAPLMKFLSVPVVVAFLMLSRGAMAADENPGVESPPLDPAAGLESIHVPDGYVVELMAAEPLVKDPVAFDWDAQGRLWVVEMADYPSGNGASGGRVRLLEDRDGDGRYDHSTLFAKGLNFPNGILTWRDGVIVTAAPDILFLRDKDGDGVADEREVLLSGLSQGNQQLRANGLRWGLDNWVYVAAGGHHGKHAMDTKVRSTRNKSEVAVGSRDFRFQPDSGVVEAQSGPTQFGRNRDDWGRWFGTQNSRPLWHYVLPDHYLRRNPHLAAPDGRVQLPGQINPPVYPASKPQKRFHSFKNSGHYTSACSGMIYRDRILFAEGQLNGFACEPFHNLVQRIELQPEGVTFSGRRGGKKEEPDFFASSDRWCRPVMVRTGPDGCLWVADMYRYMIEHPQWLPDHGKKELLPFYRHGDDRGRIYRVRRVSRDPRTIPRLGKLDTETLAAELHSSNGWVRDKVQQIMFWRADRSAVPLMKALAEGANAPQTRLHALCILEGLDSLKEDLLVKALADDHPGVRENALRMAESHASPEVVVAALKLVDDPSPRVRIQLAFSLGAYPASPKSGEGLAQLLLRDHADPFATIAALSSALPHLDSMIAVLSASDDPALAAVRRPLIEIMLRAGNTESLAAFLTPVFEKAARSFSAESVMPCVALIDLLALQKKSFPALTAGAKDGGLANLASALKKAMTIAQDVLEAQAGELGEKLAAAALLSRVPGQTDRVVETLASWIEPSAPLADLQQIFETLAGTGHEQVSQILLRRWSKLSPQARELAMDQLFSRTKWTRDLVEALGRSEIRPADLDPSRRLRLLNHPDKAVRGVMASVLESSSSPARTKVVADYRPALSLKGGAVKGRAVFMKTCVACHKLGKEGLEVGPDLRTVAQHPPEKLLVNILDPNLDIQPGYHAYNCQLKSGEQLFGMLAVENAVSITLKLPDATTRAILRSDIARLESVNLSLMPEGLEAGLSKQDLADLIAFLKSTSAQEPQP